MSAADVKPHLERVIKELITKDMRYHGFLGDGGEQGYWQNPAVDSNPGEPPGKVAGPGHATGSYLIYPGWEAYCGRTEVNPSVDVYPRWREEITELFSDWWSIPGSSEIDGVARGLRQSLGATAMEPSAESDYRLDFDENGALISAFVAGDGSLALLQGQAMNAFRIQYWGHLQRVTVRYHLVIRMLTILVITESELWEQAWKDLARLADDAAYALENDAPIDVPFGTIATIAKMAGKIPGPQQGLVNIVGTVSGVLNTLSEAGKHETRERRFNFSGDAASCVDEIRDALNDLRKDIESQERSLKLQADAILAELAEPEYLLPRPGGGSGGPGILDTTDPDDIVPDGNVTILPETMDFIADDILGEIAGGLRTAGNSLNVTGTSWSFHRLGGIGLGTTGPYDSFSALNDAVATRLQQNAGVIDDVAEVIRVVKNIFTQTDDEVATELAALDN